jgi:glycosyltransferase involved in cell wall biosynthesis
LKIAYFILNSFDYDSRARLEVETLGRCGHDIEIVATVSADSKEFMGFPIHRIAQWKWPSRKARFIQYNLVAAKLGQKINADIYHAVDLDVLQAAVRAADKTGGRVVYESRELYTELESLNGRTLVRNFWQELETRLIGRATRIITINDSIADELSRRYGVERPAVIRNVARLPVALEPVDLHARFDIPSHWKIIIYQGVLRGGQGLKYLLDIVHLLNDVALIFIGDGHLENDLKAKIQALGISDKVRFAGMIQPDSLANYTAGADAGVLLMEGIALNNRLALPQKLFQYLACGIPQIVSPMPEIAKFVETENSGLVVPLDHAEDAAKLISAFLCDPTKLQTARQNCIESARHNNWDEEEIKLRELYKGLEQSR